MSETMPLVTVVVPVYNAENYLRQCLDSIVQQTYTHLEILLINDGATDSSAAICEEYAQKDKRVRIHHKANGGVASSRNIALELLRGEYVVFIDCDDWMELDHVEKLYEVLTRTDSDIVVGNFTEFHEDKGVFQIHVDKENYFEECYTPPFLEWFQKEYVSNNCMSQCFTVPWAKMYKSSLFQHIVYPVDEKVEDDFTTYKVYLFAKKITYFNASIYCHRKRTTSVTRQVDLSHVFPLKSIEERLTLLSLLGADLEAEKKAYLWRLKVHRETLLNIGDMKRYKEVNMKIKLLEANGIDFNSIY